jgi:uncharacterized protein (TIGR03663 family)
LNLLIAGIDMELLLQSQKKRIYIYFLVLILVVGIAFRGHDITLRPIFTDEGVHYSFIYDLYTSNAYQYKEIIKISPSKSFNMALNIYNSMSPDSVNSEFWSLKNYKYKDHMAPVFLIGTLNTIGQPFFYINHLVKNPSYVYDPVYHGPFLYYLGDLVFNLAGGHSLFLLRLPIVLASVLGMFFIFLYRPYFGRFGLALALLLVALSPGLIYFSNLANYENYFAVGSLLGVGLLLLGVRKRSPWILCGSGFVLLMLMTIKETALITWFTIVMATLLTYLYVHIKERPSSWLNKFEDTILDILEGKHNAVIIKYLFPAIVCFTVSGIFFVLLYSSFGGNPAGIHDGLTSWMYWKNTGAQSGHMKPFSFYTELVLTYDFMLTFLFFTGFMVIVTTSRDKYKLFLCFWALLIWFVYSVIPYKTPWLVINFLFPFAIVAGIGWDIIFKNLNRYIYKYILVLFLGLLSINAIYEAIYTKWFIYDEEKNGMSYVHPYREFEEEIKALYTLLLASADQYTTQITVAAPEYWPLPSYMLNYKRIGYYVGVKGRDLNLNAPIIVNDKRDNPELRELLLESDRGDFVKLRDFKVRPGVTHTIFISQDLMDRYLKTGYYKMLIQTGNNKLFEESPWN